MKFREFYESVIPHPYFGKFKKVGRVLRHPQRKQVRVEVIFDGIRNDYHVHIASSDSGEMFVWVTQRLDGGMEENRHFKTVKKALAFLLLRFGIRIGSWNKVSGVDVQKMSKYHRKQMT